MSERSQAENIAHEIIANHHQHSDEDRLLARELLRRGDVIKRLQNRIEDRDLVEANRDAILRVHEEGLRRIRKAVNSFFASDAAISHVDAICRAVAVFHPMYGETWGGWPGDEKAIAWTSSEGIGPWTTLGELRKGAIFQTRDSRILAVKSEYHTFDMGSQCNCYLLASGEAAHFRSGDKEVVREVFVPFPSVVD
jgi:hypothetical protein